MQPNVLFTLDAHRQRTDMARTRRIWVLRNAALARQKQNWAQGQVAILPRLRRFATLQIRDESERDRNNLRTSTSMARCDNHMTRS